MTKRGLLRMTKRETLELLGLGGGLGHRATDRLRTIDVVEVDAVEAGVESRELLEELWERGAISGQSVDHQRTPSDNQRTSSGPAADTWGGSA